MRLILTACAIASQAFLIDAATISFEGTVVGATTVLSPPGPVVQTQGNGSIETVVFGSGTYMESGVVDFTVANPDGSSTGTGIFEIDFGDGDGFSGTYVETALILNSGNTVSYSQEYTIDSGTGIFAGAAGVALHPFIQSDAPDLNFQFVLTGSVTAPLLQPVPEPATVFITAAGLGLLLLASKKKSRTL